MEVLTTSLQPDPPSSSPTSPSKLSTTILEFARSLPALIHQEPQRNALADEGERPEQTPAVEGERSPDQLRHGVADFVSSRRAVSVQGEQSEESHDQLELPVNDEDDGAFTIHDLIGSVRQTSRVRLRTEDMTTLSVVLALWVYRQSWDDPDVMFTYRSAAETLGVAYSGAFARRWRASLLRLAAWSAAISETQKDASEKWETIGFFHFVRGHESRTDRENGQIRVSLHAALHRNMQAKRFVLYPLQSYMKLRADLAKELYRYLETQRGFGEHGAYAITVTPELLATLGCRQEDQRQVRFRLRRACEEIVGVDPRYQEAGLRKNKRGQWILFVRRRRIVERLPVLPTVRAHVTTDASVQSACYTPA